MPLLNFCVGDPFSLRDGLTTSSPAAGSEESGVERACERNAANGAVGGRVQRLVVTLLGCFKMLD
jgi:hypothetical protein